MKTIIIHEEKSTVTSIKDASLSQKQVYVILLTALAGVAESLTIDEIKDAINEGV